MRTHGWGGQPPESDEEAIDRIIRAATECVQRYGVGADLAKVADRLHVTRQTVYRYFPGNRALFQAVAAQVADRLVTKLAETLLEIDDPLDAVVQVVFYCIRHLAEDPELSFISDTGRGGPLISVPGAPLMAAKVLVNLPIDLDHLNSGELSILAEHMVRLLQGLVLDPDTPRRDDADLRHFLRACLQQSVHPMRLPR
jgi:AcrR family transcriptional regulator